MSIYLKKAEKALAFIMTFILLINMISFKNVNAQESGIPTSLTVSSNSVEQGKDFTVNLNVDPNTNFLGLLYYINYDSSKVEVTSIENFQTLNYAITSNDKTDESKVIVAVDGAANFKVENNGKLATIHFKAKESVSGKVDFVMSVENMFYDGGNANYIDYTPSITNASVEITVPPTDISALKALIEKAETYNADDYTADSFDALTTALTAAKAITDQNTKEEVAQAQAALQSAIDGLKKAVDKSALQSAVDQIPDDMSIYTPETVAKVEEATTGAMFYLENKNLEDTEENRAAVQAAVDKLLEAINGLEALPQKDVLAQRITEAEAKLADSAQYMTADVQALQTAVDAAKVVNDNENATEADVSKALGDLDKALSGLRIKADKTAYDAAVAEVKGAFSEEAYTTSSWKGYADALAKAEVLSSKMASEEVAQVDADVALTVLQNASKTLIPVASEETKAALQAAIKSAEQVNAVNFTEESYAEVDETLKTAKALDLKDTSDETVKAITQALNDAVQALVTVAKDEKTGIVVEGLEEGTTIEVTDKTDDKSAVAEIETAIKKDAAFEGSETQDVLFIADITPSVAPDGTVTLKIPVTDEKSYDEYYVGHKNEDGAFTWVKVAVKDGIAMLSVDSFGEYTVIGINWPDNTGNGASNETNSTGQSANNGGNGNVGTGVATENTAAVAAGLLILVAAGLVVYRKKFNN